MPDPPVIQVKAGFLRLSFQQASRQLNLGRVATAAAARVVSLEPALDGLLAATQLASQLPSAGCWVPLDGLENTLPRYGGRLAADVVGLKPRHRPVRKAEDVADVDGDEAARAHNAVMVDQDIAEKLLPAAEAQPSLPGLTDKVWRGPEAEIDTTSGKVSHC